MGPQYYSEQLGVPVPTRLYFPDNESRNRSGYDDNFGVVPRAIRTALHDYWTANDDWAAQRLTCPTNGSAQGRVSARAFHGVRHAATRADVVGHSMGGCVTQFYLSQFNGTAPRYYRPNHAFANWKPGGWRAITAQRHAPFSPGLPYISDNGQWWCVRPDNLFAGDMRRFVTIGTPHLGSPLGDFAVRNVSPSAPNTNPR